MADKKKFMFDVVIGNPPYQEETDSDSTRTLPIYHKFMDEAYKVAERVSFITPARFLFNAGFTPKIWNEKMLEDEHFKIEYYEQDSSKVFLNTDIKGGVVISYRDSNADFGAIGVFSVYLEMKNILRKIITREFESISTIVSGQLIYQFTNKLSEDYPAIPGVAMQNGKYLFRTSSFEKFCIIFFDEKPNDNHEYIQILGLQNNKRVYKWVRRDYISEHITLPKYKVFLPAANGAGVFGESLSLPLIGKPMVGSTQTFLSIGSFDNEGEAKAALRYISTKFARALLGLLKVTQHITTEKWKYVPLQDFTPASDIDWKKPVADVDQQLYRKYGLDQAEIEFIETHVKKMA
jgi:hypothetical protein